MDFATRIIRDIAMTIDLPSLPAAIKLEMIKHRIAWHDAIDAQDWQAAHIHFTALTELQELYCAQPVTTE